MAAGRSKTEGQVLHERGGVTSVLNTHTRLARGLLLSISRTQLNILKLKFISDSKYRSENPSRANNLTGTTPVEYFVN